MNHELLQEYLQLIVEKIRSKRKIKTRFGGRRFDLKDFRSLPNESIMQAYAMNYLEPLGQGSSRIAFVLSSKKVLKIARNEKGIAQNKAEVEVYAEPTSADVAARIYDADKEGKWVISDLVKPITSTNEFKSLTGVDWQEFVQDLTASVSTFARKNKMSLPSGAHEFTKKVYDMAERGSNKLKLGNSSSTAKHSAPGEAEKGSNKLMSADLTVLDHWGKTPDGRAVILDYGYTEDVAATHYPKTPAVDAKKTGASSPTAPDEAPTGR
jgi:hypothetical protein